MHAYPGRIAVMVLTVTTSMATAFPVVTHAEDDQTPPGMLVGGRVRLPGRTSEAVDFAWGQAMFGTLQVTRDYLTDIPQSYTSPFPADTQVILSLKTVDGDLASFIDSLDAKTVNRIVIQHEPERPGLFASGAAFTAMFDDARAKIKAIRPTIAVGIISSGFNYRVGRPGYDGSYLSPNADFYAIDTYRAGSNDNPAVSGVVPIEQRSEIMRWYDLVKDCQKSLAITESGMGRVNDGETTTTGAARVEVVRHDVDWARAHGFFAYSYFLSGQGPDGNNWLDSSTAIATMYRSLDRG